MFTKEYWKSSAVKLRQTKYLAIMATMIALKAVLANFSIPLSETLRINFGYMVTSVEAAVVGPVAGMVSGAVSNTVNFMIRPSGTFFIGYTISAMLGELFYGLFFYRRRITLPAIIGAKVSVNYLINVLLGSLWSSMLYSNGYLYYAGKSVIKNTVMLPVEITLLYLIFKMVLPFLQRRQLVVPQNKPEPEKQD
ncbi:MAG: folate family ECF transporter S component [Solobacterium sp.]|nr:folate family ECF transporter S component [Solobacterium sp.]MBQ1321084.1 folate family ECF transporter S component [Solobacterium sp.]